MTGPAFLRTLTPMGWLLAAGIAVGLVGLLAAGLGLRWDPFDLAARRLERAEQRASVAASDAAARRDEVVEERLQHHRLTLHHKTSAAATAATAVASIEARTADDAAEPLDPPRADRLHAHDRELCRLAPHLHGCPAPAGPA